jgi:hypothetical protein
MENFLKWKKCGDIVQTTEETDEGIIAAASFETFVLVKVNKTTTATTAAAVVKQLLLMSHKPFEGIIEAFLVVVIVGKYV